MKFIHVCVCVTISVFKKTFIFSYRQILLNHIMDDCRFGYITKLEKKALAQSVLISSQAFEGAHYYSGKAAGKA